MFPVLMLFLIPVGGGIPAGVLLARAHGLAWPVTAFLYFVSDVILAFLFEPVLRLVIAAGRRSERLAKVVEAMRRAMARSAAFYGGSGAGPFTLVMIAFGVDPMTGRAAAAAAGHGFVAGWAIAIAGDMMYYGVIAVSTLKLNALIGDPNRTMVVVLLAMILIPMGIRRLKARFA
ncbi:MAG: hypothetical protein KGL74_00635 [Elusimicrobia bacterium]|nr:hypothetical protein [Elusimicrobiota bacterium]MDE2509600.1 hypothetical protein [Elusimicrobiota bacterium]